MTNNILKAIFGLFCFVIISGLIWTETSNLIMKLIVQIFLSLGTLSWLIGIYLSNKGETQK